MSKSENRSIKDWHKEDIKAEIRKKGVSMAELARANGYNPRTFSNVFHLKYPKVERIVAEFLDTTPDAIWPSRYQEPIRIRRSKYTAMSHNISPI
ncbi:helix-turn-helix transcriptional regulator [Oceanobacter sp. 4_MG-2023]|uniref:helix-turn-helix domain-containing protein n=1 Tax=Oceanobacter sp. 4_MG-2023 TaxID=3062623 RepID=UPI002737716F|nr:helix-turn-helix transcriptional regulator [Oceanobacter sp. 4_MG-2023]MDP2549472.1 helix-turn-helix transcriptional regulator [Oceanobacter sp. 4_MG-2023]